MVMMDSAPASGTNGVETDNAAKLFRILIEQREYQRNQADRCLGDASYPLDRSELRRLLLGYLRKESLPRGQLTRDTWDVKSRRGWIVYALGRLAGEDEPTLEVLKHHIDPDREADHWVRYWVLAGLSRGNHPDLERIAKRALVDPHPQVNMVGAAIFASLGDPESREKILKGLDKATSDDVTWAVLRALRVVAVDDREIIEKIRLIVAEGANTDCTYDAIRALTHVPRSSPYARDAARSLASFLEQWRSFPGRDAMRSQALIGLGKLGIASQAPLLLEELLDHNPAIVREAALSLERLLGSRTCVGRVLEVACKVDTQCQYVYARALSWMEDRDGVAAELAAAMSSGSRENQETARAILSEVGGAAALSKLRAQTSMMHQHTEFIRDSERRVQDLFTDTVVDARQGFTWTVRMDLVVFAVGVFLIVASAVLVLRSDGSLESWVATGTTGAGGVLGVLYGLVKRPREKLQQSVDHLMHLKIVFLGYLRQLHQADQAYVRRLLDEDPITTPELGEYRKAIDASMRGALVELERLRTHAKSRALPAGEASQSNVVGPEDS